MNKTEQLIQQRLDDFVKILTYHLVTKIDYHFKGNYNMMYDAPVIWNAWKNHKIKYDEKIYRLIAKFNNLSLSAKQVQSIFGKDADGKWISYEDLVKSIPNIKIFNKGTVIMHERRFQLRKKYILDISLIKPIFEDNELHDKIVDATSDYYSNRQRRLIFTQINNKKKGYHYKTKVELTEEERVSKLLEEMEV